MTVLLHASDTHFGTEQTPVVEALIRFAHSQRPDLLLLSGDITQRARRHQFEAARRFVDRLNIPRVIAIPGNHDLPLFNLAARLLSPYRNYRRAFGHELAPCFESDRLLVLTANTTRWYRHKHGEISRNQVETIARRLERASAQQLRVIITHQPVHVMRSQDRRDVLRGRDHALARWSEAGADLILGGHIHLPFVCALHELDPRCERALWTVQAGTAVSSRVRAEAPNSVNLLRIEDPATGRRCRVERWDYKASTGSFHLAGDQSLQPLAEPRGN
jgi:3',5'-cyclic AMP phosphodiesterase CpdA